jgi:hypothetical protein
VLIYSEHLIGENGDGMFRHACAMGLEGIVSKRMTSHYKSGTYMFVPARTAADFDINGRLYPDGDHNGAENGAWANTLLSDASRVLGLEPLAAFAVEWEDEDVEAATA